MSERKEPLTGMFLVIDHANNPTGLRHWAYELLRRKMPAVLQVEKVMVERNGSLISELSGKGFDICGAYNQSPFWDKPYEFQYEEMRLVKEKIEACTGKPMRIFGSQYSAYDETTLKAAQALGVEYVFARGAVGAKAVTFKPEEYDVKIVSVSNVPSNIPEMSTGSLCDQSLWARGETTDSFKDILFSIDESPIVLVAQTHLSGVKLHWWNAYQDYLDAGKVRWQSLDEFTSAPVSMPNARIPHNTEVKYTTKHPRIPLEQDPDFPF